MRINSRLKGVGHPQRSKHRGGEGSQERLRRHASVTDLAVIRLLDQRLAERVCAILESAPNAMGLDVAGLGVHLGPLGLRRQARPEQVEVGDRFLARSPARPKRPS